MAMPDTSSASTGCTTAPGSRAGAAGASSAGCSRASAPPSTVLLARGDFGLQLLLDVGMDELGDVAAERGDLSHQRRGDEHVLLGRREKDGLHLRVEVAVHSGELELVFEIGHRAQAAQHHARVVLAYEVDQQAAEAQD